MPFTKIEALTVLEAVALAYAEYGSNQFNATKLASHLCLLLLDKFKVKHIQIVMNLLTIAQEQGFLEPACGPRGGQGFRIKAECLEIISEVELPQRQMDRRAEIDANRTSEANANPGPTFDKLLQIIPLVKKKDREFITGVMTQWLNKGWLSSAQAKQMEEVGLRHGEFFTGHHFIGNAMPEWRAPYLQERDRIAKEYEFKVKAAAEARAVAMKVAEEKKIQWQEFNKVVKARCKESEASGLLDGLDNLVADVFPDTKVTKGAKESAFSGRGSRALRASIAVMAFGKPPSHVWMDVGNLTQPDSRSEEWQILIKHPTFDRIRFKNDDMSDD